MEIVIIGAGTVGSAVCRELAQEGHSITAVDSDEKVVTGLTNTYDVFGVVGSAAEISTLRKANAESADLLLAITSSDEINLLVCTAGRKLGARHSVARIRNPEYTEMMQLLRTDMNLSMTINPEMSAAKEIYRSLRFPSAAKVNLFCRGRLEVAELTLGEDSPVCGETLNDLRARLNLRFLICAVLRNGETFVPNGHFRMEAGDTICVAAPEDCTTDFFKAIGAYKQPVRDILIAGGGRVTYYLLTMLGKSKIHAKVIEKDEAVCRELASEFPNCTVICEDGSNQDLLLEEGLERTDAFLTLSPVDEENVLASLYAKTCGVPKVITMIQKLNQSEFLKKAGLETIVSPRQSTAAQILRFVRAMANARGSEIEALHRIMDGQIEAIEFRIKEEIEGITGIPLKDMKLKKDTLIACIMHRDKVLIPSGSDKIEKGDTVIVMTKVGQTKDIRDLLL
ncbi:MAG: Trk system potassium transporter TrkA [Clostridia bacterium]|nr:Trk system potassium transporter TrkA [Clostridia bacterium]